MIKETVDITNMYIQDRADLLKKDRFMCKRYNGVGTILKANNILFKTLKNNFEN